MIVGYGVGVSEGALELLTGRMMGCVVGVGVGFVGTGAPDGWTVGAGKAAGGPTPKGASDGGRRGADDGCDDVGGLAIGWVDGGLVLPLMVGWVDGFEVMVLVGCGVGTGNSAGGPWS